MEHNRLQTLIESLVSAPPTDNVGRRANESALKELCLCTRPEEWLPFFYGQPTASCRLSEVPPGGPSSGSGVFALGAAHGPTAHAFVAMTALSDILASHGKQIIQQTDKSSVFEYVCHRTVALLLEVAAAVASSNGILSEQRELCLWARKLSSLLGKFVASSPQATTQCANVLCSYADAFLCYCSYPADTVDITELPAQWSPAVAAKLHATGAVNKWHGSQAPPFVLSSVSVFLFAAHVFLKTLSERKALARSFKATLVAVVAPRFSGAFNTIGQQPHTLGWLALARSAVCRGVLHPEAMLFTSKILLRLLPNFLKSFTGGAVPPQRLCSFQGECLPPLQEGPSALRILSELTSEMQAVAESVGADVTAAVVDPIGRYHVRTLHFLVKIMQCIVSETSSWTPTSAQIIVDGQESAPQTAKWQALLTPADLAMTIAVPLRLVVALPYVPLEAPGAEQIQKIFMNAARILTHAASMDESDAFFAGVMQSLFAAPEAVEQLLGVLLRQYLTERSTLPSQELLQAWAADPELYYEDLEQTSDSSVDFVAEQLFTALSGSKTCAFPQATWALVNGMLQAGEAQRVAAYHAIGLCHYTLAEGQLSSYESFFYSGLLPDITAPFGNAACSPLVQRRALWCVGMWCESASERMRCDFFQTITTIFRDYGSVLNPVITLTALRAVEHFVNDGAFSTTQLPADFIAVLFSGLAGFMPNVRSPTVIANVTGLVHVLIEKTGVADVGDVTVRMLAPAVGHLCDKMEAAAQLDTEEDDDDDAGALRLSAGMILQALTTAGWTAADASKWSDDNNITRMLLFLTDATNDAGIFREMLQDEAWALFAVLVRTTSTAYFQAHHDLTAKILTYCVAQLERDFEAKPKVVQCLSGIVLMAPVEDGGVLFALSEYCAGVLANIDDDGNEGLAAAVFELLLVMCHLPQAGPAASTLFLGRLQDIITGHAVDAMQAWPSAPLLMAAYCILLPRVVPAGSPCPAMFVEVLSVVADVTTSPWMTACLKMGAVYAGSQLVVGGGDSKLLHDTSESLTLALGSTEDRDASPVTLMMDAFVEDSRQCVFADTLATILQHTLAYLN